MALIIYVLLHIYICGYQISVGLPERNESAPKSTLVAALAR